jgi:NarL family two-component system response regulator LiaR
MVFLLKWLQWKYLVADYSVEMYVGIVAVAFTIALLASTRPQ